MNTKPGTAEVLVTIVPLLGGEPVDVWVTIPPGQLQNILKNGFYGNHAFGAFKRMMCKQLGFNADECRVGIVDPSDEDIADAHDCRHIEASLEGEFLLH